MQANCQMEAMTAAIATYLGRSDAFGEAPLGKASRADASFTDLVSAEATLRRPRWLTC